VTSLVSCECHYIQANDMGDYNLSAEEATLAKVCFGDFSASLVVSMLDASIC